MRECVGVVAGEQCVCSTCTCMFGVYSMCGCVVHVGMCGVNSLCVCVCVVGLSSGWWHGETC